MAIEQPRALVYLGKPSDHSEKEITSIVSLGYTTTITSSVYDFEQLLRSTMYEIAFWIYSPHDQNPIETIIQKSRNFSQARPTKTVVLADSLAQSTIERILRLGILYIYTESGQKLDWMSEIKSAVELAPNITRFSGMQRTIATPVSLRIFGRIGKIHLAPPGGLTVETNLFTKSGDVLLLNGSIAESIPNVHSNYRVSTVNENNLYYRYQYRLELEPLFEIEKTAWQEWVKLNQTQWVVPKSKVLWITSSHSLDKESHFDKNLFSVYVESPQSLNPKTLAKLSPRVILIEDICGDTQEMINSWTRDQAKNSVLVILSKSQSSNANASDKSAAMTNLWPTLTFFSDKSLSNELALTLNKFLKQRILSAGKDTKFISRNSQLSQFSIELNATLNEISHHSCILICDHDIKAPAIFKLSIQNPDTKSLHYVYVRLSHSEFLADHKNYRLYCDWLPGGAALDDVLPHYKKLVLIKKK